MGFWTLLLIAIGLSADAFAVALARACTGRGSTTAGCW